MSDRASPELRRLVIRPNASLTLEWAVVFMISMCAVSFGIAGVFAWLGFWMVLPFAGLEMAALAAGLWWSMRDNVYREVVSVEDDRVRVEAGRHGPETIWEFPRAWTQVRLEAGPHLTSPSRLWVGSHGRGCVLGRCLTDGEREAVAGRLRRWVRESQPRNDRGNGTVSGET